jgi:hypothetical protein
LTKTLLLLGDSHTGSTVAICPPVVNLDDGGTYHASRSQRFLWDSWLDLIDRAAKYKPTLILNGDLIEGDKKDRSYQVITRNETNLLSIGADVFDPLAQMCGAVYVVRGTMAHVGKSANLDDAVGRDLGAVPPEKRKGGASSWWSLNLKVEGRRVAIAHHASMGGQPWTSPDAARKLAARLQFEASQNEDVLPDIVFRSHVHQWADSYDAHRVRVVFLPAWTFATEYVHRIAPDAIAQIGAALLHVDGRRYEIEKIEYKPGGRKWQVL